MAANANQPSLDFEGTRDRAVTRKVEGWFNSSWDQVSPAPFVNVLIDYRSRRWEFGFLIDSGSDLTTLMPRDALEILGSELFEIDFARSEERASVEGVGMLGYNAVPLEGGRLLLEDEFRTEIEINSGLWIVEPQPIQELGVGNWTLPSILGRDAIRPGDFELSYINNTVTLNRPDDE